MMERNQHVIESLLKIVLLCGKQGLAFRGHRDDRVDWSGECSSNQGPRHPILATHLKGSPQECSLHFKRHSK